MRRREFIAALGGAAGWPVVACAQPTTMPVVGFVDTRSSGSYDPFVQGLSEVGFVDHHNVIINHREASNIDQLPAIALELVRDQAAVICGPTNAIIAARAVTATVPMVFIGGTDPVAVGLVASFSRPGGNVTGVRLIAGNLASKQLEILHELVPTARNIGLLISPQFPDAEPQAIIVLEAVRTLAMTSVVERVIAENEFEAAFAKCSGGLASYGTSTDDVIRQAGIYVGRILKGEKPADLPVQQPTKFTLAINLKTAKALGLDVPPMLLARADEVIE